MTLCSIEGCQSIVQCRGWCSKHYSRWKRYGDATYTKFPNTRKDLSERFWDRVDKTDTCWVWTAGKFSPGYGCIKHQGKSLKAHRLSYEWAYGKIPDGLVIDHICHNRACVRPEHLRAVTTQVNSSNRSGSSVNSKSGVRGVYLNNKTGRWEVYVKHNYRGYRGGSYTNLDEASTVAELMRKELFGANYRG